ncbi:mRNA splicing protein, partial [Aspergillus fumigatus]
KMSDNPEYGNVGFYKVDVDEQEQVSQEARDGPVQFEKDTTDPFGIDSMIADVTGGAGQKRYGIQEVEREDRGSKRARVDDD